MSVKLKPRFTHLGIFVRDIEKMKEFYRRVLCQTVSDTGKAVTVSADMVFFTNDPEEHHQLVLVSGRPEEAKFSICQQMSFLVESVDELRDAFQRAEADGVDDIKAVSHGNALSLYFSDPEGNLVEVYMRTPWHVPQPHYRVIDFSKSNAEILRETEEFCRKDPGFTTKEEQETVLAELIDAQP